MFFLKRIVISHTFWSEFKSYIFCCIHVQFWTTQMMTNDQAISRGFISYYILLFYNNNNREDDMRQHPFIIKRVAAALRDLLREFIAPADDIFPFFESSAETETIFFKKSAYQMRGKKGWRLVIFSFLPQPTDYQNVTERDPCLVNVFVCVPLIIFSIFSWKNITAAGGWNNFIVCLSQQQQQNFWLSAAYNKKKMMRVEYHCPLFFLFLLFFFLAGERKTLLPAVDDVGGDEEIFSPYIQKMSYRRKYQILLPLFFLSLGLFSEKRIKVS